MTEAAGPLVSVRGEARESVQPDAARVSGRLVAIRPDRVSALAAAAEMTDRLTRELVALGGAPLSTGTLRHPLTWSLYDTGSEEEWDQSGKSATGRTGNLVAVVWVALTTRDLEGLQRLTAALSPLDGLSLSGVSWIVDEDNPAWPRVRAAAISAAVAKARDYAAALGSALVGVDHLADPGLLGGADGSSGGWAGRPSGYVMEQEGGGGKTPSLTPVPQELVAVVDGRFRAAPVRLGGL